jgi:hypothetical protein
MTSRRILFHVVDRLGRIHAVHEHSPMHAAFRKAGPTAPGVFIAGNPYTKIPMSYGAGDGRPATPKPIVKGTPA